MSSKVFKQELWSKQIQNELDILTGLRTHSDYSYDGEIKKGNVLHITGSVKPTVGDYVPGTDIKFEKVSGTEMTLVIDKAKYATQLFDDVDRAQSIAGVMENATREMAKELHNKGDESVADVIKDATEKGVKYKDKDDQDATETIKQESTATAVTKTNARERVEDGLVGLYENNVNPNSDLWGEFTPKYFSCLRQSLTETLTNNVELAKTGAVGKYNNVKVCIENLLPKSTDGTAKYNVIRTGKAIAFAGQIDKVEAGRVEKQFADYVKALFVFGTRVVRPKEMYIIKEKISGSASGE